MRGERSTPTRRSPALSTCARSGRRAAFGVIVAGVAIVGAPPASAAWTPGAAPASAAGPLLADDTSRGPLLSGDGRYVVFATSASVLLGEPPDPTERYVGGIVRKDLVSGEVQPVAPPQRVLRSDGTPRGTGTEGAPSGISHDGRYVLFGTRARLSATDGGSTSPDVYVRDMTQPASGQAAYELVSAQDGSATGADYADPTAGSVPGLGGYALSGNGRRAVFVTAGASNLPASAATDTPPQQVWVRDLDARTTRLISRTKDDGSAAGTPAPQPTGQGSSPPTAAVSADGSTVVWTAGDAERQTPTLPGERPIGIQPALLWRRLDAITAPSRRVAGEVDLDDPACAGASYAPSDTATGPCYGPFLTGEGVTRTPSGGTSPVAGGLNLRGVSADGARVLFLSSAYRRPLDDAAYRASTAYLSDMRPGVPRKSGVSVAWSYPNVTGREPIEGGRLAADGRHALFVSRDNRFDGLQPVGAFPTATPLPFNVFSVDLDARTVELVTRAADGGDYATTSQATFTSAVPSPSADGTAAAFTSPDGNLFLGDANGVEDVLVARVATATSDPGGRILPPPAPPAAVDTSPPAPLPSRYFTTIGRVVVSKRTGTATVRVAVPTGGTLTATARGTATRTVRRNGRRRTVTTTVAVGSARRTPKGSGTHTLTVKVGAKARTALRRSPYRLSVRLEVAFRPRGAGATRWTPRYTLRRSYVTPAKKARKPAKRATPKKAVDTTPRRTR